MDELEQRLIAAMTARAELVTEESLRDDKPAPAPARHGWRLLVAEAAVVLAIVAVAVASSWQRADPPARPVPPPPTVSPTISTVPAPTTAPNVSLPNKTPLTRNSATAEITAAPPTCAGQPCELLSGTDVGAQRVELWGLADGTNWQVRVDGVVVPGTASRSAAPASGVTCWVVGRPVCLVAVSTLGDESEWTGVEQLNGQWRYTGATFVIMFGATEAVPRDVDGNGTIEVVGVDVSYDHDGGYWTAHVWRWDGTELGCTESVDAKEKLPGWPAVAPDLATLVPCIGG